MMTRAHMLTSAVVGVLIVITLCFIAVYRPRQDEARTLTAHQSRFASPPSSESQIAQSRSASREKRQVLVDTLNITLTRPAVGGPYFATRGPKTGVWKWSLDEYDTALVMTPHDYVQPTSYDDDVLCSYFYPLVVNYDLTELGFKQLIVAFPHMNLSCDINRMVFRDAGRRSRLMKFERTKMMELGVASSDTQWEEGHPYMLGSHQVIVLGMKTTMTNENYRLVPIVYWWQFDMDSGDATQLAAYDSR